PPLARRARAPPPWPWHRGRADYAAKAQERQGRDRALRDLRLCDRQRRDQPRLRAAARGRLRRALPAGAPREGPRGGARRGKGEDRMSAVLGVLGGSGLYDVEALEEVEERRVSTPFGPPSDAVLKGRVKGTDTTVLFLPRHGRGHRIPPSAINYRANICALKL